MFQQGGNAKLLLTEAATRGQKKNRWPVTLFTFMYLLFLTVENLVLFFPSSCLQH